MESEDSSELIEMPAIGRRELYHCSIHMADVASAKKYFFIVFVLFLSYSISTVCLK
jgi:hypothetical protein